MRFRIANHFDEDKGTLDNNIGFYKKKILTDDEKDKNVVHFLSALSPETPSNTHYIPCCDVMHMIL